MDTDTKYRDDEFFVTMAGERAPERFWAKTLFDQNPDADRYEHVEQIGPPKPRPDHHRLNENVPVDGDVTFYDPQKLDAGEPFKHGTFPFRSVNKSDAPWFARPDADDDWGRHPVWKWQNPSTDPKTALTLAPSIGMRDEDGNINFHAWIEGGSIRWV